MQRRVDEVYVDPALIEYAVRLADATREPDDRRPRRPGPLHQLRRQPAGLDQPVLAARALAFVRGRDYALPAGRHRPRPRRAAPPAGAVVRGAVRRDHRRPAAPPGDGRAAGPRRRPADAADGPTAPPTSCCAAWSGRSSAASTGSCRARTAPTSTGRDRLRRPAHVHAGGRRPAHRLERHRPPRRALRAPVHRGPRAHRVAAARPLARRWTFGAAGARQGRRAHRAGRHAGPAAGPRRQPRRRAAVRRARGAGRAAAHRPHPRAAAAHELAKRPPARRRTGTTTDLAALLHAAPSTIRRRSLVFVISDFITGDRLGAAAGPSRAAPRGGRRARWSTRSSGSCPTSG